MDGSIVNLLGKNDIPKSKIQSILRIILIHNKNKNCKIEKSIYINLFLFEIIDEMKYHNSVNAKRALKQKE